MSWFLDLSRPEGQERATSSLNNLESHTREITLGVTRSTETGDQNFVVLINETHTTISWDVGSDLLIIFLQLNSDTLSNSGVWLLSLDCNLFDNDTGSMGSLSEWFLPFRS